MHFFALLMHYYCNEKKSFKIAYINFMYRILIDIAVYPCRKLYKNLNKRKTLSSKKQTQTTTKQIQAGYTFFFFLNFH